MAELGGYNQIFYANEALAALQRALGMASRVYLGYDAERRAVNRGETIRIKVPSTFTAVAAPGAASTLRAGFVDVVVDQFWEVKYALTDKELAFTGEQIMTDHIRPAAYAIANKIDQTLAGLYAGVPWLYDYGTATDTTLITGARGVLFDNETPMDDDDIHMMVDGTIQTAFLNSTLFHSAQVAGAAAEGTLLRGTLGTRFGVEVFANQNTPTHVPGTGSAVGGDGALAVNNVGGYAAGVTSIAVDAGTGSQTLLVGDTFVIAGNTQRYVLSANTTLSTGAGTLTFTPPLAAAVADDAVVTFTLQTATAHSQQMMFHRNAFAYVSAPLPDNLPNVEVFTAVDPVTGLSLRARRWADPDNSQVFQCVDALWGVKVVNPNMAVRLWT